MLLNPIKINKVKLLNRLVVAPMCQYSGIDGNPSKWHYGHLRQLVISGAGMLMIESTAVSNQGRISLKDLTLRNKKNEDSFKKIIKSLKKISKTAIGIQISHSGRKGSSKLPWVKSNTALKKNKSWITVAPSPISRDKKWPTPKMLQVKKINKIIDDFKSSAIRAKRAGFDCLEIHMAHGYLLHQFFSPISNKRTDSYGVNLNGRCKLLLKVLIEVRKVWPRNRILGARITGIDWLKGGVTLKDSIYLTKKLKKNGLDYVCVSSGGILPKTKIVFKPGYQVHLAKKIKKSTGILTRTAGMITSYEQASKIVKNGSADLVAMARKFINDPNWLIRKAKKINRKIIIPNQYKRCF